MDKPIVLRGFVIRQTDEQFAAVCVKPFLATEGRTREQAVHKMQQLIRAYLSDAAANNDLDGALSRRAPLAVWLQYYRFKALHYVKSMSPLEIFKIIEKRPTLGHA